MQIREDNSDYTWRDIQINRILCDARVVYVWMYGHLTNHVDNLDDRCNPIMEAWSMGFVSCLIPIFVEDDIVL